jgi:hypothetical protein
MTELFDSPGLRKAKMTELDFLMRSYRRQMVKMVKLGMPLERVHAVACAHLACFTETKFLPAPAGMDAPGDATERPHPPAI